MTEFLRDELASAAGAAVNGGKEEDLTEHDMGKGGMMTQSAINAKFEAMMEKKGPVGAMMTGMTNDEIKRKVVLMELNEPTEGELRDAADKVHRRVASCQDDEDHRENHEKHVKKVPNFLEKKGGKVVAYVMNAQIVHDVDGHPTQTTVGSIAGNVSGIEKCLLPHVASHVSHLSTELGITWEEALTVFSSKIRAEHYSDEIKGKLLARTAGNMMKEAEERGVSPEEDPAMSHVLVSFLKKEFKSRMEEDGGPLGALAKLAEMTGGMPDFPKPPTDD